MHRLMVIGVILGALGGSASAQAQDEAVQEPATEAVDRASTDAELARQTDATDGMVAAGGVVGVLMMVVVGLVGLIGYFMPTGLALLNSHPNWLGVFALNLLLGWACLGWIGAFVWALSKPSARTVIVQQAPQQAAPPAVQCHACGSWEVAALPNGQRLCGQCGQRG